MSDKTTQPDMPAFPRTYNGDGHNGMTLRDYFAAKAMPALIGGRSWTDYESRPESELVEAWANGSYKLADAMLKARAA